jgi:hypothetical protein
MPDAQTIAIGAEGNDGNGKDAGHTRVFAFGSASVRKNGFVTALKVSPNPTPSETTIDLSGIRQSVSVVIRNTAGQEVLRQHWSNVAIVQINIPGESGVYLVEVNADNKRAFLKLIKN